MRSDGLGYWFNTADNNVTDPEGAGAVAAGWVPDFTTGAAAVTMTSANVTLTAAQYGKPIIVITGLLTANLNLIFPNIVGEWIVINSTTGPYTITCKTAAGTGVVVNSVQALAGDATNIYSAVNDAISSMGELIASAGGTADALTATFSPAPRMWPNGVPFLVRAASANATTTPTFTANSGTLAAKTIVKGANAALVAGDIAGAGHWLLMQYDVTLDKVVLLNPATGVNTLAIKQIQTVGATVAVNAMTVTLNPTSLDFRSTTLNSGAVNTRTVPSQLSLTIPSTATLGTVNAVASRILLLAIDNAGTVELAVYNAAGGANLDETGVINTTAIAAGSNSLTVYSQTARTGVPYRIVGFVDSTQATAGTWVTAPSSVQGIGGQALAAMSSIGYGQTYQSTSIVSGTTYYNTKGKPSLLVLNATGGQSITSITINGAAVGGYVAGSSNVMITIILPTNAAYSVVHTGLQSAMLLS